NADSYHQRCECYRIVIEPMPPLYIHDASSGWCGTVARSRVFARKNAWNSTRDWLRSEVGKRKGWSNCIPLHRRRMPANGDWSLCFLRHARGPRARPEHRCGDENDLRRVRSLWLSACCRRTTPSWHCRERQENPPAHARACVESKAAEAFCRDDG